MLTVPLVLVINEHKDSLCHFLSIKLKAVQVLFYAEGSFLNIATVLLHVLFRYNVRKY